MKRHLHFLRKKWEALAGGAIVAAHVPLSLVPKVLDTVYVVLFFDKLFAAIDAQVMELGNVEYVVATKAIGIDDAIGLTDDRK